jgi:hypothetical protein
VKLEATELAKEEEHYLEGLIFSHRYLVAGCVPQQDGTQRQQEKEFMVRESDPVLPKADQAKE